VRDEADQARYIVERILENREEGALLKKQAVLFRTSSHSGPLEIELTRRNIPFVKFGGLKFLDAAHVKDMLALLRFVENPRDRVAGFRVMHLLPGIGPASAQRIFAPLPAHPAPATTGPPSSIQSETSDIRNGHRTWSAPASGTNHISTASTKTPRCGAQISFNSDR
jgi:DNA helicase-2/ATP-dependent DNA helicase PcrA